MCPGTNLLFDIIEAQHIELELWDFSPPLYGVYLCDNNIAPTIGVAKSILNNERKVRSILAEELGHHFTTAGNYLGPYYCYSDKIHVSKAERLAMKWACDFFISDREFDELLSWSHWCIEQLAEHFAVTKKVVYCKLVFRKEEMASKSG